MALLSYVHIAAISVLISSTFALQATDSCSGVTSFYQTKGFGLLVLDRPALAENSNVCSGIYSCCTTQTEERLTGQSKADIQAAVLSKSGSLAQLLLRIHDKYDAFFQQLIETARKSLDALFGDTYEDLYTADNKMVFMKFFDDLKLYYRGGVVDLPDNFDSFFTTLLQRVFKLRNPMYIANDDYMQCIGENLDVIKPFEELPQNLLNRVQRSFIAARTLVQALKTGERVASNVGKIYPTTTCITDYMKIAHCSKCSGHVSIKPCQNMCDSVLTKCLCNFGGELNSAWNKYVEKMMALVNRLDGSYNIESVLFPIDVEISEAIKMLQENMLSIKKAVTRQCGDLPKNPNATTGLFGFGNSGNNAERDHLGGFEKAKDRVGKWERRLHGGMRVISDSDPMHLSTLLNEMHMAQRALTQFWKKLPEVLCAESAELERLKDCWNGKQIIRYIPELSDNSVTNYCSNITSVPDPSTRRQITILKDISAKLSHAYNGVNAAFLDQEIAGAFSGDSDKKNSQVMTSIKEDNGKEEMSSPILPTETIKKDKLIRDLKNWEINLIRHAFGRSFDVQMTLKDIKANLMKHPLFEKNNKNASRVTSGEKFGNLTHVQHIQLKKILGVQDGTTSEHGMSKTSGTSGVTWYSLPTSVLALSLQWTYMMV